MKILLVDDEISIQKSLSVFINRLGHDIACCSNGQEAIHSLQNNHYDLIISDIFMPLMDGHELLKALKKMPSCIDTFLILMSGHGDVKDAVEAMRNGAYDYILKPINIRELKIIIDKIQEILNLRKVNKRLTEDFNKEVARATKNIKDELNYFRQNFNKISGFDDIAIFSNEMKAVFNFAEKLQKNREIPVLINGETGTGKEVIAKYIHFSMNETFTPFIAVNCSALSAELFESELFGYEEGSFTGASSKGKKGKIELAENGTIFLDEIGEISQEYQAKLLRLIQEREFFRVGGTKKIRTNARIICATNQNISERIQDGTFRDDLFHRLSIGFVKIPPLRNRKDEVIPLLKWFLNKERLNNKTSFENVSEEAEEMLINYSWPGNIRELKHLVKRISLLFDDKSIRKEHLEVALNSDKIKKLSSEYGRTINLTIENPIDLHKWTKDLVNEALKINKGNKTKTAEFLNISRSELYTLLK